MDGLLWDFFPSPAAARCKAQWAQASNLLSFAFFFFLSLFKILVEPASAGDVTLSGMSRDGTGSLPLKSHGCKTWDVLSNQRSPGLVR